MEQLNGRSSLHDIGYQLWSELVQKPTFVCRAWLLMQVVGWKSDDRISLFFIAELLEINGTISGSFTVSERNKRQNARDTTKCVFDFDV